VTEQTEKPAERKPEQIEAEIASARNELADSIDVIEDKLRPANLLAAAKARVISVVQKEDGSLDPVRAAAVAGVALLVVTYIVRRARL
jgi:Protein of unknown function (DUF3618)